MIFIVKKIQQKKYNLRMHLLECKNGLCNLTSNAIVAALVVVVDVMFVADDEYYIRYCKLLHFCYSNATYGLHGTLVSFCTSFVP